MPAQISLEQIKIMTGLELCNLFGINVLRFSKDTRAKKRAVLLSVLWAFLIMMLLFYVGGLSYGLVWLGAEDEVISCLIAVSSILIFIFDTDSGDRSICLVGEAGGGILLERVSWNLVRAVIANDRGDPCGCAGFRYFRQDEA